MIKRGRSGCIEGSSFGIGELRDQAENKAGKQKGRSRWIHPEQELWGRQGSPSQGAVRTLVTGDRLRDVLAVTHRQCVSATLLLLRLAQPSSSCLPWPAQSHPWMHRQSQQHLELPGAATSSPQLCSCSLCSQRAKTGAGAKALKGFAGFPAQEKLQPLSGSSVALQEQNQD